MALAASFCMLCAASMSAMTMLTAFASGFARLFRIKFMRCPFLMRSAPPGGGNCPLPLRIHRAKPSGAVSFRLMLRACFCSCHNALYFGWVFISAQIKWQSLEPAHDSFCAPVSLRRTARNPHIYQICSGSCAPSSKASRRSSRIANRLLKNMIRPAQTESRPDRHEGKFRRFRHFFKHSRYFFMTADVFIASAAHTLPLYTVAQLRALEADAARTLPPDTLMMPAGKATAAFIRQRGADCAAHRTWIAAGPGNNGGDALAAATELHQQGVSVEVCMPARVNAKDACHALDIARAAGVCITDTLPDQDVRKYQWAIDGLFGIGLTRPLDGIYAELARRLSRRMESGSPVLALDLPSGLNSDTGARVKNGSAVKATHTLTFIGVKAGLYTADGRDYAGEIWLAPLGLDVDDVDLEHSKHKLWLNAPDLFKLRLPARPHAAHKGDYGNVTVLGGHTGMMGAPMLAARAALFAGAGKVRVALMADAGPAYDPLYPELMLGNLHTFDASDVDVWVIGCGIGRDARARAACADALAQGAPTVIDADALNLIAQREDLAARVAQHPDAAVLTPHPLEAARLLRCDANAVQHDRLAAARALAAQYSGIVVLKGSGTVIAAPDGHLAVNPTGHAGLATGGSGDVLSGLIGALIAQRMPPFEAALAAVFLHGRAAEILSDDGIGPAGLNAGALAPAFRRLLNSML